MSPTLLVVPDDRALARRAAEWIVERTRAAVTARGTCAVALAGGSTPRATYEVLAASALARALPWPAIAWYFGDERAVPPDDPESNYRAAAESLFAGRPEMLERVHRMPADAALPELAAKEYGRLLPDPLDVLLLGMGEDGHTASLFPGAPALGERAERAVAATGPKAPYRRMTITPPVIERARDVLVLASGAGKAETLARALEGPVDVSALPVQLALRGTWIVDAAAAGRLSRR
ncbi:MAG TPA: 6-phosphogluconolactonase [Vicinamibacteria bacterium]